MTKCLEDMVTCAVYKIWSLAEVSAGSGAGSARRLGSVQISYHAPKDHIMPLRGEGDRANQRGARRYRTDGN